MFARVAQWIERTVAVREVVGPIPIAGTNPDLSGNSKFLISESSSPFKGEDR